MAKLIPADRQFKEFSGSIGEQEIYELFKLLPDEYVIFHSAEWSEKTGHNVRFGEADFLIYHQEYGVICLEVKHGGIKGIDGRIYQINSRTNQIVSEIDPMAQARRSSFKFLELINDKVSNEENRVKVYYAVWFTMINQNELIGELPHNYHLGDNTFFRDDMKDIDKTLLKCFKFYNVKKREPSRKINRLVVRAVAPEFKAFPSLSTLFEQNDFAFNQMTREQSYLLDYLEEQKEAAIQGGAGTGKTMMAIEKARRLSEEEQVIFLCFNSLLIDYMTKAYNSDMPNVTFTNLDRLAYRVFGRLASEEEKEEFLENFDNYPNIWKYKSIIIDEGQDFTDNQIRLLKEIALLNEGSFYVFYDRNQLVQQRSNLTWLNEMDCQLVLSFNCRNTKEIAETSSAPIHVDNIKVRYELETNEKPTYHNVTTKKELIDWLENRINYYLKEKVPTTQIVILTVKTMEKSWLSGNDKIAGIPISDNREKDSILFTTSRKFKGLESDVVILIDIDLETFSNMEQRRVFYVGSSRAKSSLELVSTLESGQEKNFYRLISDGKKQRISAVMEYLKAKPI